MGIGEQDATAFVSTLCCLGIESDVLHVKFYGDKPQRSAQEAAKRTHFLAVIRAVRAAVGSPDMVEALVAEWLSTDGETDCGWLCSDCVNRTKSDLFPKLSDLNVLHDTR